LFEQAGLAIEIAAAGDERAEHHREENRLLIVELLEQAEQDARTEQQGGEVIRGVQSALQAAREQQQRRARETAKEVRDFNDGEREKGAEPSEPAGQRRRRPGEEQDRAGQERRRGEHTRHDRGRDVAGDAREAAQHLLLAQQEAEHEERGDQDRGREIVYGPGSGGSQRLRQLREQNLTQHDNSAVARDGATFAAHGAAV